METWDLPEEVDLRTLTCSENQLRFALGLSRHKYEKQVNAGVFKFSVGGSSTNAIPVDVELDMMTVTQKQFALAVGKSPARINQLVKQGVLVVAPNSRKGRLMFLASMEKFFTGCK